MEWIIPIGYAVIALAIIGIGALVLREDEKSDL